MKTKIKGILSIALIVVFTNVISIVIAQPGTGGKQAQREKIEAQRVAFITDKLDLTPAEAQAFWPVYNEYDAKRHELGKSFRDAAHKEGKDIDQLTDKQATELADNQIIEAQKQLDLRKDYHSRFKSILPPKKVLKLYDSEREFQRHLLDRLHEDHDRGQGEGRGTGHGQGNQEGPIKK